MDRNLSIEDEIFASLDTMMQNSDPSSIAEDLMWGDSSICPVLQKEHFYHPEMVLQADITEKVNCTQNEKEDAQFIGSEQIIAVASESAIIPSGNDVLDYNVPMTSSGKENGSISNMHPATVADNHLTLSSNPETHYSLTDDLTHILKDIYQRPEFIDQLISSLYKDVQIGIILIKFITHVSFRQKFACYVNNQSSSSGIRNESILGYKDVLIRLCKHYLKVQAPSETSFPPVSNNTRVFREETVTPPLQLLDSTTNM